MNSFLLIEAVPAQRIKKPKEKYAKSPFQLPLKLNHLPATTPTAHPEIQLDSRQCWNTHFVFFGVCRQSEYIRRHIVSLRRLAVGIGFRFLARISYGWKRKTAQHVGGRVEGVLSTFKRVLCWRAGGESLQPNL